MSGSNRAERRSIPRPYGMRERFGGPRALWWILALAVVAASVVRIASYSDFLDPPELTENDFSPDYVSAKEWRAGRDPYGPLPDINEHYFGPDDATARQYEPDQRNPHPPSLIVMYAPLSAFGFETARTILLVVMLVATFLALFLFLREIGLRDPTAAVLALGGLALPVVGFDMRWAQMNGLLLLGLVLAWRDIRRGHDLRAGILLGAATALKIFPWMFLIPLLRTRKTKAAGWMLASAIGVTAVGVGALGLESSRTFLRVATPGNVEIWGAAPHSISIVTLPFRLFASARWLDPSVGVPPYIGLLGVGLVALCAFAAWHTSSAISRDPFWSVVPWMILATPIAWAHYLVVALPLGFLVLLRRRGASGMLRGFLVLAFLLFAVGPSYLDWLSGVGAFSLQDYGNVVAGTTLLIAGLAVIGIADLRAERGRGSGRRDSDDRVAEGLVDRDVDSGTQLVRSRDPQ